MLCRQSFNLRGTVISQHVNLSGWPECTAELHSYMTLPLLLANYWTWSFIRHLHMSLLSQPRIVCHVLCLYKSVLYYAWFIWNFLTMYSSIIGQWAHTIRPHYQYEYECKCKDIFFIFSCHILHSQRCPLQCLIHLEFHLYFISHRYIFHTSVGHTQEQCKHMNMNVKDRFLTLFCQRRLIDLFLFPCSAT